MIDRATCSHPDEACMYSPYDGEYMCFECMTVLEERYAVPEGLRQEWAADWVAKMVAKEKPINLPNYLGQQLLKARQELAALQSPPEDVPQPELVEAHFKDGETNMVFKYPGVAMLAGELGRYFTEEGGTNYVQARLFDDERKEVYVITVQPDMKPMPSEIVTAYRSALTMILNHTQDGFARENARQALEQFGHLEPPTTP